MKLKELKKNACKVKKKMKMKKTTHTRRKNVATQKIIQCIIYTAKKIKDDEENYGNIKFSSY